MSRLPSNQRYLRFARLPNCDGIEPLSPTPSGKGLGPLRWSDMRLAIEASSGGLAPVRRLPPSISRESWRRSPNSGGIEPVS